MTHRSLFGAILALTLLGGCARQAAEKAVAADAPGPWNGIYGGVAINDDPAIPERVCPQRIQMENMKVAGDYALFGQFSGQIGPDGTVTMQGRDIWIWGQFGGGAFTGQVRLNQVCTYHVRLALQ